ncbi:DUF1015 domain-containing protein [Dictyobacter formicarum]|uniref:Phosphatase n=1 Tax=Dictyobacter formicarum TaxID=2778368 RepID=A0ABQ3VGM1_9CHLR|nr:DUF1015 domain-containing protein [Dictyobacter formicarum]GHO84611.1 phosphatase [Dictyobacter formicarum]
MADVQPLRGFRYVQEKVGDLVQTVTPPFDVITPEAQARYYQNNPYNIIRLELGQTYPTDSGLNNVYTRAARTLAEWRLDEVLQQEAQACYYLYQQRFTYGGQNYTRTSLLARVRLEPWDAQVILPHEYTRNKDKEDRLQLLRACSTNFSPIMCMYDDPQGRIRRLLATYTEHPEVQFIDENGEEHLLQPISDPEHMRLLQDFFAPRQLYIADGHHRYTTALNYRDELYQQRGGLHPQDGANFMLMALINVDDPGMLVLPTHRVLFDLTAEQLHKLTEEQLTRYFSVQKVAAASDEALLAELARAGSQQPALIIKTAEQALLLTINEQGQQLMKESGHSEAWNSLDVAMVQHVILETLLHITAEDVAAGKHIRYMHDTQHALQALSNKDAQAIILLNGIPFRQVRDVALADDRMPQKSTYLYPKLITGLVINPLW